MCSEHIIFVRVVNHHNLITVGGVWSSQYSHTVCLVSTDCPHKALDLIGSLRMLVRGRTFSTTDIDRTPSILICWLFGYSGSSAEVLERLMNLFLRSDRVTTLVAHFLTSRTLGRNPKVLSEKPAPLSVSFLFSSFPLFSHVRDFSHTTFSF